MVPTLSHYTQPLQLGLVWLPQDSPRMVCNRCLRLSTFLAWPPACSDGAVRCVGWDNILLCSYPMGALTVLDCH